MNNPATIQVSREEGLFGVVASMLGFHPADSMVMVCLTGQRRRVGPVVRVDLAGLDQATMDQLAGYAVRYADEVMIVVYTDEQAEQYTWRGSADALASAVRVLDVVVTGNNSNPIPENLAAASALLGRRVVEDRSVVARSIEHQPGLPPSSLTECMDTVQGRDALITRLMPGKESVPMLVTAAQSTPDDDPHAADLCMVLAMVAYRHGDEALAQIACDRALRLQPAHRLAHLMLQAIAAGIRPEAIASIVGGAPE